ncbi:uncharacterized protein [Lolium perenne]|uniref:uncharacterized protein n=1 Tax=Lolium perenne TaxID=4522 RepID=UPI0021F66190|nr:uncharacterized protein LOC127339673 [Lolium perenne]
MGDDSERAARELKEMQEREASSKLAIANPAHSSAGFFSISSLHAQAVGLSSIKGHVPVELALDTGVHRQWCTFFRAALHKYALLDHIDTAAPSDPTPEWTLLDATVVSWLYGSVSLGLLDAVMKPGDDPIAVELWTSINGLFTDHKINRQLHLSTELDGLDMGELTMKDYLTKVKSLSDGLTDLGAPVDDAKLVIQCLNGLPEQYDPAADLISLMPGMNFDKCRSLLELQDMKKKNRRSRSGDTALYSGMPNPNPNPGKGDGKGKKKKKKHDKEKQEKEVAPVTAPAPAAPSWTPMQLPWNGAIQVWPYGQDGLLGRQHYVPRPAPPSHAYYAHSPYGAVPSYGYGTPPLPHGYGNTAPIVAPPPPAHSTTSWDQQALLNQFQTMGLQAPPREWVMDTGASSHFASDPGSAYQDRDSQMQ